MIDIIVVGMHGSTLVGMLHVMVLILLLGYDPTMDLVGNAAGHMYYFVVTILPELPLTEGVELLRPPKILVDVCRAL